MRTLQVYAFLDVVEQSQRFAHRMQSGRKGKIVEGTCLKIVAKRLREISLSAVLSGTFRLHR